jgi:hypothetical protein
MCPQAYSDCYYSLYDDQCDRRMAIGSNSTSLSDLFWSKMEYHSVDEEYDEKGRRQKWQWMYVERGKKPSIRQMLEGCYDFEFTIIKHDKPFPEYYESPSGEIESVEGYEYWTDIDEKRLDFVEAIKEFDMRYKRDNMK